VCRCSPNFQMVGGECTQCAQGLVYDPTTGSCLAALNSVGLSNSNLSYCQAHEVVVNNQCVCDQWSISSAGKCYPCQPATFKANNFCQPCPSYCLNCSTNASCDGCRTGFDLVMGQCVEKCGDGRRFVVPCDDGNNQNGDGCSASCTVETGWLCSGGSEISSDVCQKVDPSVSSLSISVESGYPLYTSSGIITNFIVTPPMLRSQSELSTFLTINFENLQGRPATIFLSQSDSDPASIRCMFFYNNNLPSLSFRVTFAVADPKLGSSHVSLLFDTIGNSITSAIRGRESTDILN
jgi:cysteine-rich repeat protein